MIEQMPELCLQLLYYVFLASWRVVPVFVVVAIATLVLRNRVPARYLCWLWLIVVARLLLPVSATSVMSISSVVDAPVQALLAGGENVGYDRVEFSTYSYEDADGTPITVAQLPDGATAEQQAEADAYVAEINAQELPSHSADALPKPYVQVDASDDTLVTLESVINVLVFTLFLGFPAIGIILLLRGIVSHYRFAWMLWSLPAVTDRETIDCLLRVCDDVGVGRRPKLKEVLTLDAPAMFGLVRPTVCLPVGWRKKLTMEQLEWVLRHEVAHIRGRDGLLLFIATLAKSVHWFNPLSWVAVSKLQHSMERAADELTTLHLKETQIREYGELLLRFAAGQPGTRRRPTVGLLAMAAPKDLRRRIESLGAPVRRLRWLRSMVALAVITMVAVCGLTDAKTVQSPAIQPRRIPNIEVALADVAWKKTNRPNKFLDQQDRRIVSINVEKALQKAKELEPGVDAEKFVKAYFGFSPLKKEQGTPAEIVDGMMTVHVTQQQEALMKQMLSAFEQSGLCQIITELRVIDTDIRFLDPFDWSLSDSTARFRRLDRSPLVNNDSAYFEGPSLSIDISGTPNEDLPEFNVEQYASLPVRAAKINHEESVRFIHQVQSDIRSNIIMAPKVTMFNGQRGLISDCVQRPFVTDVLEVNGDSATALQPKISVFEDGWKFLIKTSVTDEEQVKLQMVFTHSSVDGVKLANLPNARGNSPQERVTIQVPTVNSDSIAVESVLNEDEALLVFSPRPYSDEEDGEDGKRGDGMGQVFMIRTTLIPDNDSLKSFVPTNASTPVSQPND
jgi:beta-lactamase regulating signal transducer with metallopeptidase domain